MKNIILFISFFIISCTIFAQSEKTLLKSFVLSTNNVFFDFDCEKSISTWDKNYVKFEFIIKSETIQPILDKISQSGRYDFEFRVVDDVQIFSAPKTKLPLRIGEKDLKETYFIKIYIPENVKIVDLVNI